MPWIKKVKRPHQCREPFTLQMKMPGSLWKCRKCSKVWEVRSRYYNGFRYLRAIDREE